MDGGSKSLSFDRPPLPPGGEPNGESNSWGESTCFVQEDDWPDPNDYMGPASATDPANGAGITPSPAVSTEVAWVEITNSGDDLFGPRGGDQNGGLEGDCIEVVVNWAVRVWEPGATIPIFEGDVLVGFIQLPGSWKETCVRSEAKIVCPEGGC